MVRNKGQYSANSFSQHLFFPVEFLLPLIRIFHPGPRPQLVYLVKLECAASAEPARQVHGAPPVAGRRLRLPTKFSLNDSIVDVFFRRNVVMHAADC